MAVSAISGEGVEELAAEVAGRLPHPEIEVHLVVPYARSEIIPWIYRRGEVLATVEGTRGTDVRARISAGDLHVVEEFVRPL